MTVFDNRQQHDHQQVAKGPLMRATRYQTKFSTEGLYILLHLVQWPNEDVALGDLRGHLWPAPRRT